MHEISTQVQEALDDLFDSSAGVTLTATGDTYHSRKQLKSLGFEWDGSMEEWRATVKKVNDEGGLWVPPAVITTEELDEMENAGVEFAVED